MVPGCETLFNKFLKKSGVNMFWLSWGFWFVRFCFHIFHCFMRYLSLQNMRLHVAEIKLVGKPLLYVEVVKVCNATEHAVTTQKDQSIYI